MYFFNFEKLSSKDYLSAIHLYKRAILSLLRLLGEDVVLQFPPEFTRAHSGEVIGQSQKHRVHYSHGMWQT